MKNMENNEINTNTVSAEQVAAPVAEKTEGYTEVDRNMIVAESIDKPDLKLYDVRCEPFEIYGFYDPYGQPYFRRVPKEVAEATNPGVIKLSKESVGARIRFATDSSYVAIKAVMPVIGRNSHTPLEASAGFDLYEDYPDFGESRFIKSLLPQYKMEGGYEQVQEVGPRKLRYFTLNFPVHSCVKDLYIGLQEDAALLPGLKYRNKRPVVVYGSSIVHGTGATRPGLVYTNILSRRMNLDVSNFGFSGNAKGEDAIVDFLAGLDMSIFICDYDHNSPNVEHLRATHRRMYERFREKQPKTPYIMISRPNVATYRVSDPYGRRDVIVDTFRYARENGDRNVWYIDGESFFLGKTENDCTIDTVHPNDLGYSLMADGIACTLRSILAECDCLN